MPEKPEPLYPGLTTAKRVSWDWYIEQLKKLPDADKRDLARKAQEIINAREA